MTARWMWWTPVGLLLLAAALVGLRWGHAVATLTETDVINHYASQYVAEGPEGADVTDCVARPDGREGVWLIVICGADERMVRYSVDRFGRLVARQVPGGPEA